MQLGFITRGGAVATLEQSHATASGNTIVGKHGERRKIKETARNPNGKLLIKRSVDWNIPFAFLT